MSRDFFYDLNQDIKNMGEVRSFVPYERSINSYPWIRVHDGSRTYEAICWCSNDYLCLSIDPDVLSCAIGAIEKYGYSSGGTRNIAGTTVFHEELEKKISCWCNREDAILFNSAYMGNYVFLSSVGRALDDCIFLSDSENHASLIEGIRSSKCHKEIFRHNDMNSLEESLKKHCRRKCFIVFESIYSMSGDRAPIKDLVFLAKKYNAFTYVDEVHAIGLYGLNGEGLCAYEDVDCISGTLAKSVGCMGGFITAKKRVTECVKARGSGFIFTSSLPPSACIASIQAIDICSSEKGELLREKHHRGVQILRHRLEDVHIDYRKNDTHITIVPSSMTKRSVVLDLIKSRSTYVQLINYPTVSRGNELFRITSSPLHDSSHVEYIVDALKSL